MNYKSYADLSIDILNNIFKVPSSIQLIIGIPRSGMVPAYMIGAQLNLPVTSIRGFLSGSYGSKGERNIRVDLANITEVLVVDDSVYSGTAINKAKAELNEINKDIKIYYCAIYSVTKHNDLVDIYFKYLPNPRVFQWNYKNHFFNTKSCFDIDGVLCVDPTEVENDDDERYRDFLLNAKPLFIPSIKISCLVTSRLEKYRLETISWLETHKVDYDELIMLDLPNAKKRRELNIHAKFKADVFANRNEEYFIESNWEQAKDIFKISKKPVFCTFNDVLIKTYTDIVYYENAIKYSDRHFNDIFSDKSELGEMYQQLKIDYDALNINYQKLNIKTFRLENNQWIKFSKLNFINKCKFLSKKILSKIKKY